MKQTIEMLIKRWINVLDECDNTKKEIIFKNINHVKREMRYALKIMENNKEKRKMNENLNKLQQKIMTEIDFFTDEDLDLERKEERLKVSEMINKLANTYIQAENIIERKRLNDVKFKENERLIGKYNGNSN